MGCSSSSAQTVDQEKRPGTKPEESNGDTVAVRNGIVAEDAQTIEDQMQLPVQTASPDDLQPGTDDEAGAVLVALEAKEDLGSVEDLQSAPAEPAPEAAEVFTQPEAALIAVEALPSLEEVSPVEIEVKPPVEATGEATVVESDLAVPEEAPVIAESTTLEPVVTEQAKAAVVVEGAANLGSDVPAELVAPVEAEISSTAPAESREQNAPSEPPLNPAVDPNEVVEACDAPAEAEKPVINEKIAEATIPEMPPLYPVTAEVQDESQPAAEEVREPAVAPAETHPLVEAPYSLEDNLASSPEAESAAPDDAAAVAQIVESAASTPAISETRAEELPEASPADITSESIVDNAAPTEATTAAADPAHELSPEVVSANEEASQEIESEKTKKED